MLRDVVSLGWTRAQRVAKDAADIPGRGRAVYRRHTVIQWIERTGVNAEAQWINLVIYVQDLRVTSPVETRIENLVGGQIVSPGKADQLYSRGRNGVEHVGLPGRTGRRHRVSRRWRRLKTVRKHVAAGELHLVVHLVVDLDKETVHRIGVRNLNDLLESARG